MPPSPPSRSPFFLLVQEKGRKKKDAPFDFAAVTRCSAQGVGSNAPSAPLGAGSGGWARRKPGYRWHSEFCAPSRRFVALPGLSGTIKKKTTSRPEARVQELRIEVDFRNNPLDNGVLAEGGVGLITVTSSEK